MSTDTEKPLIPAFLATGAIDQVGVVMLLAYRGASAIGDGKNLFLTLDAAIRWNEAEAADASSNEERRYREALATALKGYVPADGPFTYSLDLWGLWARVFETEARGLLKSRNSGIPASVREAVTRALQ